MVRVRKDELQKSVLADPGTSFVQEKAEAGPAFDDFYNQTAVVKILKFGKAVEGKDLLGLVKKEWANQNQVARLPKELLRQDHAGESGGVDGGGPRDRGGALFLRVHGQAGADQQNQLRLPD